MLELIAKARRIPHRKEGLVGITEQPTIESQRMPAAHAGIVAAIHEHLGRIPVAVIERDATLGVWNGGCRLAHRTERCP